MDGYTLEGIKWRSGPVTWSFSQFIYPADAASRPFSSFLTPGAYQNTVVQAVQKWASVSGIVFQQVPDSRDAAGAADIRIGFGDLKNSTDSRIGETWTKSVGGYFPPDIVIRLEDPNELPLDPVAGGLGYRGAGATLYQVILHELGHALGLGHSSNPDDIMYFQANPQIHDLTQSDIDGIRALYPTGLAKPLPQVLQQVALHGAHTDYIIAQVSGGQAYVQDTVAGRDGTQILSNLGQISFTDGSGLFDPTGRAEDITRLYQGAFGRAPDLAGLDGNTALVTSNTIGLAGLAASFTTAPEFIALYGQTDTATFVSHLYQNILHRAPDAGGQDWINYTNTTSRGYALLAFSNSQENHRQTLPIAGSQDDAEATRLYQAALNRAPDSANFSFIATRLQLGATVDQLAQGFVDSPEFAQRYGNLDASSFVTQLYSNALHRAPDAVGQASWVHELMNGTSRGHVAAGFADSNENRIATATATHDAWVYIR